ncbi:MAG: type II toxin-antitoxin system VapC family toxin [Hyphomonadaceae bacterium]
MRLLLDSHSLLWALFEQTRLSAPSAAAISDPTNEIFASAVSPYELEWKKALGKLTLPNISDWRHAFRVAGYDHVPLTVDHAQRAARLPTLHRDPWDRLIVAQAGTELMTLITRDRKLAAYGVATLW